MITVRWGARTGGTAGALVEPAPPGGSESRPAPARTPPPARPHTVLVVEDDGDICDLIATRLRLAGHRVLTAGTGPAALELAREHVPDAIILDIGLPGMSGLDVCFRLRADFSTAQVPVLMLTARSQPSDVAMGLALGARDYMIKPFNARELVRRVGTLLPRDIR
jgi:DNA-binding response OmpR family regulator